MSQKRALHTATLRRSIYDPDFLLRRRRQLTAARASFAILRPFGALADRALLATAAGDMRSRSGPSDRVLRGRGHRQLRLPRMRWLAGRARQHTPMGSQPAPWLGGIRRWSPAVMPPLLSLLLLLVGILLSTQRGSHTPLVAPHSVLPLLVLYLVFGTLYGLALYLAPTLASWLAALVGGALIYLGAMLWILGGLPAAIALVAVVALAGYVYVRRHLYTVPAGQAHVTSFAGGYSRTLLPGTTLLMPEERPIAQVDTNDRQFACPTQRAQVDDAEGEPYAARAAATVAYHVVPALAHLAVLTAENWEQDLRELACGALQEALGEWGRLMLDEEAEVPERFLATTMLRVLRPQARAYGVLVLWLSVRDMWLTPDSEIIPVADWRDEDAGAEHVPAIEPAYAGRASPQPRQAPRSLDSLPPIAEARGATSPALPLPPEALSADALSDAYQAVRDGQIHDPETIRDIARAFLAVAANEELNAGFPFDAVAAAQILIDKAAALEQPHADSGSYANP